MRLRVGLSMLAVTVVVHAQDGQSGARPGWPCVAGRPVDSTYLDVSESTGGQLFLLQKGEVGQSAVVMSASYTHPATVFRAVGNLNGSRDFEFPVDPGVASMLLLVSVQCRNSVLVYRPGGPEVTDRNSAQSVDLQAGRIVRIDQPEPGPWRVRLVGNGLFVLSLLVKADTALSGVAFSGKTPLFRVRQDVEVRLSGQVSNLRVQLVDATGERVSDIAPLERTGEGRYVGSLIPQAERFRVLVTGIDQSAWPFERMYPVLFRAQPSQ